MFYKTPGNQFANFKSGELKTVNAKGESACWEFLREEPGLYIISDGVPIEKYDPRKSNNHAQ